MLIYELNEGRFHEYCALGDIQFNDATPEEKVASFTYPWQATTKRVKFVESLLHQFLPLYRGIGNYKRYDQYRARTYR